MQRVYQQYGVNKIWEYFEHNSGNPVIAMPTGTGKSHMIADLIRSMVYAFPTTRCMMVTHSKELIGQNFKKFVESWPNAPVGIYSAGLKKKEYEFPITFAGIGSVARKAHLFNHIDILFIDECDLVSQDSKTMYRKFLTDLRKTNPRLKVVGLTATPWRPGIGLITAEEGGIFTDIAVDMTGVEAFNWFIEEGYLSPLVSKPTKVVFDTENLHIRGGEFVEKEMQMAFDKPAITQAALREAFEIAEDRKKWLIFASGVEHAQHVAQELCAMGRECQAIYNGMDDGKRKEYIDAYVYGELPALSNNNILTVGFDAPQTDLLLILRATMSSRLWVQMLGRGTRVVFCDGFDISTTEGRLAAIAAGPKQNCMVLDYSRNIERLGPVNDPVIPRKKGSGPGQPAPVKRCDFCDMHNHASARYCGGKPVDHPKYDKALGCGKEFVFQVKLKVNASTENVVKATELPIVQTFPVNHVSYSLHTKVGTPPMMRVTYYSGIKHFSDYICIEHPKGSPGRHRAESWWRQRCDNKSLPLDVDEALDRTEDLQTPTHIDVHTNVKYPVIKRYCFDGSAFGRQAPTGQLPMIDTAPKRARQRSPELPVMSNEFEDDDIPF